MSVVQRNASKTYGDTAVLTATPGQLVVLLYGGAVRFLMRAEAQYSRGDRASGTYALHRALAIVDELNTSLDMSQGEVSTRLRGVYLFAKRELMGAAASGDAVRVSGVTGILRELQVAWEELVEREGAALPESVAV